MALVRASTQHLEGLEVSSPELLRAAPARLLLRRLGSIFSVSEGSADTFDMSQPVELIDAFLSHSWKSKGWLKTVALMYRVNLVRAVVVGLVVHALVHGLDHAGLTFLIPPVTPGYMFDGEQLLPYRWQLHYVPACLAFLVMLLFGQEVPFLPQTTCFLDKCCIHQTDNEKKMAGIRQLGGFLHRSKQMVILWQPEYFTRLWCVYEVAAFHFLNPHLHGLLHIVPLKLPLFTVTIFIFHLVASISLTILSPLLLFSSWHAPWVAETIPGRFQYVYLCAVLTCMMFFGLYLVPSFFFWKFCKWHMEDRRLLLDQLQNFSMDQTECFMESDRLLVEGKIQMWFGSTSEFERYVREELYDIVHLQLDRHGPMRYRMSVVGALPHFFISSTLGIHALEDGQWNMFWHLLLVMVVIVFCADAIALNLSLRLADTSFGDGVGIHKLTGPASMAFCFAFINGVACGMLTPAIHIGPAIGVALFFVLVTFLLYGGRERSSHIRRRLSRRLSGDSEKSEEEAKSSERDEEKVERGEKAEEREGDEPVFLDHDENAWYTI